MMLSSNDQFIVTIDFGSTVDLGESIPTTTPGYALDIPAVGAVAFDLVCLATSLLQLIGENISAIKSRDALKAQFGSSERFAHRAAVMLCECNSDIDVAIRGSTDLMQGIGLEVLSVAFPL